MSISHKISQEVEIDHLLAEEFACDSQFGEKFLKSCGFEYDRFLVKRVIPEPSLGGEGFGDLYVEGEAGGKTIVLLIEDKITASAAVRQAQRYAAFAKRLRAEGYDVVWTVLVSPKRYRGQRELYDANIDLETVARLMTSENTDRLEYRRNIIRRAIAKASQSGVAIADPALHQLKQEYITFARGWCEVNSVPLNFPPIKNEYYDGDSWIDPIHDKRLPDHVKLRHRLWTSVRTDYGQIDLISITSDASEKERFRSLVLENAETSLYSVSKENKLEAKGIQISLRLPQLRQVSGFDRATVQNALELMNELVIWYIG